VATINELGRFHNRRDLADVAIFHGWPVSMFKTELLKEIVPESRPLGEIGMSSRDLSQYSILRGTHSVGNGPQASSGRLGEGMQRRGCESRRS
jgi:hypothetical protein